MNLIYLYIPKYKVLENAEFHFDPRYNIQFEKSNNRLIIDDMDPLPANFWGNHVYSVTSLVGANGAGKSTLLKWIEENLTFENEFLSTHNNEEIIVCYNSESKKIIIYTAINTLEVILNGERITSSSRSDKLKIIHRDYFDLIPTIMLQERPLFSYQNNFHSYDPHLYDISEIPVMLEDYKRFFINRKQSHNLTIYDLSTAYFNENSHRILTFLTFRHLFTNKSSQSVLDAISLPSLLIIYAPRGGEEKIRQTGKLLFQDEKGKEHSISYEEIQGEFGKILSRRADLLQDTKNRAHTRASILDIFIENFLLSLIAAFPKSYYSCREFIRGWASYPVKKESFLSDFSAYLRQSSESNDPIFTQFKDFLMNLDRFCDFNPLFGYHVPLTQSHRITEFLDNFMIPEMIGQTIRYFDLGYAHDVEDAGNQITEISNGEFQILNLLSRFFYIYHTQPKLNPSLPLPQLIVLDEAENSFHPEWQRRFVGTLVDFFNRLFQNAAKIIPGHAESLKTFRVQLLYTTHSPITLSDMPGCCVNFIERAPGNPPSVTRGGANANGKEPFGANVFDLYRDSFFMKDGLVGAFATQKIRRTVESIENLDKRDNEQKTIPDSFTSIREIKKLIEIVGDPRIREYLSQLLKNFNDNSQLSEIEILRKRVDMLENENKKLKESRDDKN